MSGMPTEAAIRTAVEKLRSAPAKFQSFAENFMRIQCGDIYRNLVPQGRNTSDQATVGYPDAYAQDDAKNYYLIETTTGDWRKHLDTEDLVGIKKIIDEGKSVAAFTLFTMSEKPTLSKQNRKLPAKPKKTTEQYTSDIEALGVPLAGIKFIFFDQLVAELKRPAYLRLLSDIGLPIDISPFYSIDSRLLSMINGPTKEEFDTHNVVAPDLLKKVSKCFESGPLLLLEGGSGLGKTTLATAIGFQWQKQPGRGAYYLDFSDFEDPAAICPQLIQLLKIFGDAQHLFVLDNCHRLRLELLKQVLNAHAGSKNRPAILALTRKQKEAEIATLCRDLKMIRMALNLRLEDLRAVYTLVARRNFPSNPPMPSDADLKKWHGLYADLVSFSLALAGATESLRSGIVPRLSEHDAIDYLRTNFVDKLSQDERDILVVIAHCAQFEFPASRMSLKGHIPKVSQELGWVIEQRARNHELRYGLSHAKIGALLLKVLNKQEDEAWESAIKEDFFQACYLVQQLLTNSDETVISDATMHRAKSVLERVSDEAWTFSERFSPGYSGVIGSLFRKVGLEERFKDGLNSPIATYIAEQERFLSGLPSFLEFAEQEGFSDVVTKVWSALEEAAGTGRMERAAQQAPVGTLHNMIRMSKERGDKVHAWFVDAISTEAIARVIANKFNGLDPELAEKVLRDLGLLAPKLHAILIRQFTIGTLLETFSDALAKASTRSDIRKWMRRPLLLGALAGSKQPLLSDEWLSGREFTVLHLLLTDPRIDRSKFQSLEQNLIAKMMKAQKRAKAPAPLTGKAILVMICMADASSAKKVAAYIRSLESATLENCLKELDARDMGALLLGAVPVFGTSILLQELRTVVHTIVQQRITAAQGRPSVKPPGRLFLAMHLAVTEIAGTTNCAPELKQAIALVQTGNPLTELSDKTDPGSTLHRAYWKAVEQVFVRP